MRKTLNIITIILNAILIVFFCVVKLNYYNEQGRLGGVNSSSFDIIWIPASILITVLPMLAQTAVIAFVKFKKQLSLPSWMIYSPTKTFIVTIRT